ncbi:MAG: M14 family zinc carboxypeptidase [Bacteroidota bacterium]
MKWLSLFFFLLPFTLLAQGRGFRNLVMADRLEWGTTRLVPRAAYPTYDLYEQIMQGLARRYPDRCELQRWGTLPSGREILTLRITKDVKQLNDRPRTLCSATMHGDETAGYWLLLQLAEHLLTTNPDGLLDELDIFLNPLANPDGAFLAGNHTLTGARRGNANGVDLNRNYPDPDDGNHPDNNAYQPETRIFMEAARQYGFDLAINLHGGAEVFNYPWDTYRHRHADTDWWRRVSRDFANRAQSASDRNGYFRDRQNGVTNGHDWYPIAGSRQDYMNFYHRCREATLEVSDAKRFPANKLPALWNYVRPALLGYLAEARYGIHGRVIDYYTGRPVRAHVTIPGHDRENSAVFSDGELGDFHRFLAAGNYDVKISAPGYAPQWRRVSLRERGRVDLDVSLLPVMPGGVDARKR